MNTVLELKKKIPLGTQKFTNKSMLPTSDGVCGGYAYYEGYAVFNFSEKKKEEILRRCSSIQALHGDNLWRGHV